LIFFDSSHLEADIITILITIAGACL